MQLFVVLLWGCAALASARPQQRSGYDYPAPQDGGVTAAFDSLRQLASRTSGETAQRAPSFQQQLTSPEAGFQRPSQEAGGSQRGTPTLGFGSRERGSGQQAGYDSSAELQIGLRQPAFGGSLVSNVGQSHQTKLSALGSFENFRGSPSQFQTGFGSKETGGGVGSLQRGLPSAEILAPGPVQDIASDIRSTQGSTQGSFLAQQVPEGQAAGFPTGQQQQGQVSPQPEFGSPNQPSQFGVGPAQPAQSGASPTNFARQAQQPGQAARPAGPTGTLQTQIFGQSQGASGQDLQTAAVRGPPEESHAASAQYNFKWDVNDQESKNFYGHQEERDGTLTRGRYYVTLPDTRVMTVEYYADETGYHPTITFEGEAEPFIPPPPRQTTAAGGPAQGTTFDGPSTGERLQGSVGFPGFSSEQFQPQTLRGIGAQGQAQIPQQFTPQTSALGQPGTAQGIAPRVPPQQGLGGNQQQTTTAPEFSQVQGLVFGRPTQSPANIFGNLGTPRTGIFGTQQQPSLESAQPGIPSPQQQQPGFNQRQEIPAGRQPQGGTQTFGAQPQQSPAFAGQQQNQAFGAQTPLSLSPGSQIRGFSSVEQGGQPGFQPSQRIAGTPRPGTQQPGQLYETPQQGSPSGQQLAGRAHGFSQQSGETFPQTNFGRNQQPFVHSSGEIQGLHGQQPSQGFTQQPSQGFTQQPSQGFTQQPSQGFTQQPSQGFTQQPSQGFTQQPSQGFTQQPSQGFTQQPSPGLSQQSSQEYGQQTVPGGAGQPSAPGSQGSATPQQQGGPEFQQRIIAGPAGPVPQRPSQLYGPPQA